MNSNELAAYLMKNVGIPTSEPMPSPPTSDDSGEKKRKFMEKIKFCKSVMSTVEYGQLKQLLLAYNKRSITRIEFDNSFSKLISKYTMKPSPPPSSPSVTSSNTPAPSTQNVTSHHRDPSVNIGQTKEQTVKQYYNSLDQVTKEKLTMYQKTPKEGKLEILRRFPELVTVIKKITEYQKGVSVQSSHNKSAPSQTDIQKMKYTTTMQQQQPSTQMQRSFTPSTTPKDYKKSNVPKIGVVVHKNTGKTNSTKQSFKKMLPPTRTRENKSAPTTRESETDIDSINDVTRIAGIDLDNEDSYGDDLDSVWEPNRLECRQPFLNEFPLRNKIALKAKNAGLTDVSNDVNNCISFAVESKMIDMIHELVRFSDNRREIHEHKTNIRSDERLLHESMMKISEASKITMSDGRNNKKRRKKSVGINDIQRETEKMDSGTQPTELDIISIMTNFDNPRKRKFNSVEHTTTTTDSVSTKKKKKPTPSGGNRPTIILKDMIGCMEMKNELKKTPLMYKAYMKLDK